MSATARVAVSAALLMVVTVACSRSPATQTNTTPQVPANLQSPRASRGRALGRVADVAPQSCIHERAPATLEASARPSECRQDADCAAGRNGRCLRVSNHGSHGPSLEATRCSYDVCFADGDCGPREVCQCDGRAASAVGDGHLCVSGDCASDSDCGAGRYCRRSGRGRFCHSADDECVEETVCVEGTACQRDPRMGRYRCMVQAGIETIVGMR